MLFCLLVHPSAVRKNTLIFACCPHAGNDTGIKQNILKFYSNRIIKFYLQAK